MADNPVIYKVTIKIIPQMIQTSINIILKLYYYYSIKVGPINSLLVKISVRKKKNGVISDKTKWELFQVVAMSVQLYGCTTETLIKHREKKWDGNYIYMLCAILNKSWK